MVQEILKIQKTNLANYKDFFKHCNILNVSETTSYYYSEIRFKLKEIGKPIPENDIWIAANALENQQIIITSDKHLIEVDKSWNKIETKLLKIKKIDKIYQVYQLLMKLD